MPRSVMVVLLVVVLSFSAATTVAQIPGVSWSITSEDLPNIQQMGVLHELADGTVLWVGTESTYLGDFHYTYDLASWQISEDGTPGNYQLLDGLSGTMATGVFDGPAGDLILTWNHWDSIGEEFDTNHAHVTRLTAQMQEVWSFENEIDEEIEDQIKGTNLLRDEPFPGTLHAFWVNRDFFEPINELITLDPADGTETGQITFPDIHVDRMIAYGDDFLLVGSFDGDEDDAYRLAKLDYDGEMEWETQHPFVGLYEPGQFKYTVFDGAGVVLSARITHDEFTIRRHADDGSLLWSELVEYTVKTLTALPDDQLLVGWESGNDTVGLKLLDASTGDELDTYTLDDSHEHITLHQVHVASNGDLLVLAETDFFEPESEIRILRLGETSGVDDLNASPAFASRLSLHPVYPNPFNSSTTVTFDLSRPASLNLAVFDLLGREVAVLADGQPYAPGSHRVVWDASGLPGGTYFLRAQTEDEQQVSRMLFLK